MGLFDPRVSRLEAKKMNLKTRIYKGHYRTVHQRLGAMERAIVTGRPGESPMN